MIINTVTITYNRHMNLSITMATSCHSLITSSLCEEKPGVGCTSVVLEAQIFKYFLISSRVASMALVLRPEESRPSSSAVLSSEAPLSKVERSEGMLVYMSGLRQNIRLSLPKHNCGYKNSIMLNTVNGIPQLLFLKNFLLIFIQGYLLVWTSSSSTHEKAKQANLSIRYIHGYGCILRPQSEPEKMFYYMTKLAKSTLSVLDFSLSVKITHAELSPCVRNVLGWKFCLLKCLSFICTYKIFLIIHILAYISHYWINYVRNLQMKLFNKFEFNSSNLLAFRSQFGTLFLREPLW